MRTPNVISSFYRSLSHSDVYIHHTARHGPTLLLVIAGNPLPRLNIYNDFHIIASV